MARRFKILAIAAAVAAIASVAAASAGAQPSFHSSSAPAYLRGIQFVANVYTFSVGTAKCLKMEFKAEMPEQTAMEIAVHPDFLECRYAGRKAIINTTGCNYKLTVQGTPPAGTAHIACAAGSQIVITPLSLSCSVSIAAQTPTTPTVDYANQESKSSVLVTWTLEGISYTSSDPACGPSGTNGTLSGSVLFKSYSDQSFTTQTNLWVE